MTDAVRPSSTGDLPLGPLPQGFGVRVQCDSLGSPSSDVSAQLRHLLAEYDLVVIPEQSLSREEQQRLLESLDRNRVLQHDPAFITNERKDGPLDPTGALAFHSNMGFLPEPMSVLSLLAVGVGNSTTATAFCSTRSAYRRLPANLAERAASLMSLHVMPIDRARRNRVVDVPTYYPRSPRPLVVPHAVSGEPMLYISWMMIDSIIGLPEEESEELLRELASYLHDPDYVYRHEWRNGDLVIWDNVAVLHGRDATGSERPRRLQRAVTSRWDFWEMYPNFPVPAMT